MKQIFDIQQQNQLRELCEKYGTVPCENVVQVGSAYLEKLLHYNRTVPLISRAGNQQALAIQLFLTSLAALEFFPKGKDIFALDIGSGGGFPAIPLKIARSEVCWELIEARERKCTALEAMIAHLSLADIIVTNARYEHSSPRHAEAVQIITARAGSPAGGILNWARRFPALRSVLVFESSAKQNLNEYSELENDFYLFNKKEITSGHGVESLWLLSFEKRQ